jgi:hypothetical protein
MTRRGSELGSCYPRLSRVQARTRRSVTLWTPAARAFPHHRSARRVPTTRPTPACQECASPVSIVLRCPGPESLRGMGCARKPRYATALVRRAGNAHPTFASINVACEPGDGPLNAPPTQQAPTGIQKAPEKAKPPVRRTRGQLSVYRGAPRRSVVAEQSASVA